MNRNILQFTISGGAAFLLAAVFVAALAAWSPAFGRLAGSMDAKVTFNNKTDRSVFVAVLWMHALWKEVTKHGKEVVGYVGTKGWYKIEPGKSRVLTFSDIDNLFGDIGFYAESSAAKGQKKYIWQGKDESSAYGHSWRWAIHPTRSFTNTSCSMPSGGKSVIFRPITLKEQNGAYTATVNLAVSK